MSKNCKIAIIVSVITLIALIVVLASAVFCVKKVSIVWYKTPSEAMNSVTNEQFLEKSGVANSSVFLLDREKAVANIEATYPDVRVINIEVVWPNVMKIHVAEREKVYALPIKNGKYAIVDEHFKVLEVLDFFASTKTNAVLINTDATKELTAKRADTINIFGMTVWNNAYNAFLELERDLIDFRAIVASTTLTETTMTINTHMGVIIKLDKPFANTRAKMRMALKTFDLMTTEDYPNSIIEVFVNEDGELTSRIYKE